MKKIIVLIFLFFNLTYANAQKLTFEDLTSTFKQPSIEKLEVFLQEKGFEFFRKDIFLDGKDTTRTYRPIDRSKFGIFHYRTYKSSKSNKIYNYQITYVVFHLDDFKTFGELLLNEKYKKVEGKPLSFENDKYLVDLEVVKVTNLARAYNVIVTNKQLGPVIAEIEFDKLLNKVN